MDVFDSYFGVGAGLNEDSQPMIDALRGQKRQGDILGLSTLGQVAQLGQNQSAQALAAGKKAGGLKMARELEERKQIEAQENQQRIFGQQDSTASTLNQNKIGAAELLNQNQVASALTKTQASIAEKKQEVSDRAGMAGKQYIDTNNLDAPPRTIAQKNGRFYEQLPNEDGTFTQQEVDMRGLKQMPSESQATHKGGITMTDGNTERSAVQRSDGFFYDNEGNKLGNEWTEVKKPVTGKSGDDRWGVKSERKDFLDSANDARTKLNMIGQYKPEYHNKSGLPLVSTAQNWYSKTAGNFAPEDWKAKEEWWRDFEKQYTMMERHELFGSAFTESEKKAFDKIVIKPDMTDRQIKGALATMDEIIRRVSKEKVDVWKEMGLDGQFADNRYSFNKEYQSVMEPPEGMTGGDLNNWKQMSILERREARDAGNFSGSENVVAPELQKQPPPEGTLPADIDWWNSLTAQDQALLIGS